MAKIRLKLKDLTPAVTAGIQSIKCECGWEGCWLKPEETDKMIGEIFSHLVEEHQIRLPTFTSVLH